MSPARTADRDVRERQVRGQQQLVDGSVEWLSVVSKCRPVAKYYSYTIISYPLRLTQWALLRTHLGPNGRTMFFSFQIFRGHSAAAALAVQKQKMPETLLSVPA